MIEKLLDEPYWNTSKLFKFGNLTLSPKKYSVKVISGGNQLKIEHWDLINKLMYGEELNTKIYPVEKMSKKEIDNYIQENLDSIRKDMIYYYVELLFLCTGTDQVKKEIASLSGALNKIQDLEVIHQFIKKYKEPISNLSCRDDSILPFPSKEQLSLELIKEMRLSLSNYV